MKVTDEMLERAGAEWEHGSSVLEILEAALADVPDPAAPAILMEIVDARVKDANERIAEAEHQRDWYKRAWIDAVHLARDREEAANALGASIKQIATMGARIAELEAKLEAAHEYGRDLASELRAADARANELMAQLSLTREAWKMTSEAERGLQNRLAEVRACKWSDMTELMAIVGDP